MSDIPNLVDAFTPAEVATKVKTIGVYKATMPLLSLVVLSLMAGAFIAFGAMYYTVVITDSQAAAYGVIKLLGGIAFSLGFIMVVIAGAELFTGNTLVVMAWAKKHISLGDLLKNWSIVYLCNTLGALAMVYLVYLSGFLGNHHHQVGATAIQLGVAKVNHSMLEAFVLGIFCNVLVCLASWMAYASRTVTDKILAIIFPISAFVAMGFEHSIANLYMIPVAMLAAADPAAVTQSGLSADQLANLDFSGLISNLIPVTLGNIVGGALFVAMTYYLVYVYSAKSAD